MTYSTAKTQYNHRVEFMSMKYEESEIIIRVSEYKCNISDTYSLPTNTYSE